MHRFTGNELRLDCAITPVSPLCIQAHDTQRFVRAAHPLSGETSVYIPGSTLKSALRRVAENILDSADLKCCTPDHPCAARDQVKRAAASPGPHSADLYRALCPACRLFGSPLMRSHLTVIDAFPAEASVFTETRDIQGQSVEVVQDDTFYCKLALRNFERWHVGLLAMLLARFNIADAQIGARRSAGMGSIAIRYTGLALVYPGPEPDSNQQEALQTRVHGIGHLLGADNAYGFTYPDLADVPDLPDGVRFERGLGYSAALIMADNPDEPEQADVVHYLIDNVLTQQALAWGNYLHQAKV